MRLGKGKRRLLAVPGFALLTIVVILLSIPVWLPWVLKPVGSRQGLIFTSYQRNGYSRLALNEVTFTNADLHFHAKQAEILTPTIWLWRCLTGPGQSPKAFLRADGWLLDFLEQTNQIQTAQSSTYSNTVKVADSLRVLRRWLPAAQLSNGLLRAGKTSIAFPAVSWSQGDLNASVEVPDQKQSGKVQAHLKEPPFKAEIQSDSAELQGDINIAVENQNLDLQVSGLWQTNKFISDAHFGRESVLPNTA